ncbi:pentatricopeptide repeat-containing protein [Striga asiatica]|uniref:Pentatricopeptide repeat-containing protein n=1 Tax=Striga asiatica TaxID=4170 RepID=A0A5A7NXP7_STRAF|nr:pentatricopeptide repeat-containing protein [Striga asiatica]
MKLAGATSRRFTTPKPSESVVCRVVRDPIRELHAYFIRTHQHRNPKLMCQIIKSYALSQKSTHKACSAFSDIDRPTLPVWNHMIRGLAQSHSPVHALNMFEKMRAYGLPGDNLTFIYLCKACAKTNDILVGKIVHTSALKLGFESYLYVQNALVHMYGFCGELGFSRKVFDEMPERDLVSWNSIICAYSQCTKYEEVLGLFNMMMSANVIADAVTLVKVVLACNYLGEWKRLDFILEYIENNRVEVDVYLGNTLIDVCGRLGSITLAWKFFNTMSERNIVSWNAMIIGLARSGDLVSAKKLFYDMPERDVVSWTSMIIGYSRASQYNDAIKLFQEMMRNNRVEPDRVAIATVLSACAHLGRLDFGRAIHDYIVNKKSKSDIYVENALIDMYCKCGSVERALRVFHNMKEKDSISWTSVISGLAFNGDSKRALGLYSQMRRDGTTPIHGTFVGVLLACAHSGLVDRGLEYFNCMQRDFGLEPEMRHYGCMVDLLCRADNLSKAYEFIRSMPVEPDVVVWRILLSACKVHGDLGLARIAFEKLLELDPNNGGNYMLSCNSYAAAGKWEEAIKMREWMMERGDVIRPLGWSCIETGNLRLYPLSSMFRKMGFEPICEEVEKWGSTGASGGDFELLQAVMRGRGSTVESVIKSRRKWSHVHGGRLCRSRMKLLEPRPGYREFPLAEPRKRRRGPKNGQKQCAE